MARRRYQTGCLFVRGKRRKMWVARWREDVIKPNGSLGRVIRSEVLGPVSELSKREAHKLLESRLRPLNEGRHQPQSTISFAAFAAEQFEPGVLPTFKFSTQQSYSTLLRKHLLPHFDDRRLCDISGSEIQRFLLSKLQQGYAWETVNRIGDLLSKVLGTAVKWGFLSENPAHGIALPERTLKRPPKPLTVDELRKLLAVLDESDRTIVLIAALAGLRIGEVIALRWGRIELDAGTLAVEQSCYRGRFGSPKTRLSRRQAALAPSVVQALLVHRSRCIDDSPESLVFSRRGGKPISADTVRDHIQAGCVKAGVRRITLHELRHTHSTLLHAVGTPLKVLQTQLGHSSTQMTLGVYTHALPDAHKEAVAKLEAVLFPTVPISATGDTEPQSIQ